MGSTIVTSGSSGLFPGHTFIFEATFTMTFTLCAIRSERLSTWYRSRLRYHWYTFVPQVTSFQPLFWSSRFDLSLRQYFMKATTWFREREKTFFITTCFVMFCFFIPGQRGMSFTSKVIKWVLSLCLLRNYVSSPLTHKFQKDTVLGCVHSTQMQLKQCTPHVPKTMDIVANARLQNSKFTNCDL